MAKHWVVRVLSRLTKLLKSENNASSPELSALKSVAECDLSVDHRTLDAISSDSIRSSLSTMIGNLNTVVRQTYDCADKIREALPRIGELAQQSDQHSTLMSSVTTQFEELSIAINRNSELSNDLARLVETVGTATDAGKSAMGDVVSSMDTISEHSGKISQFTEIIDQIAFQTNLLALNAAVEAARAGEQGRGFAVVATEVRALAKRSADAAREITDYIAQSEKSIDKGRESVSNANNSMEEIDNSVTTLSTVVQTVSDTTSSQESHLHSVNRSLSDLNDFGSAYENMSEEVLRISNEISDDTNYLTETVKTFKLTNAEFTHPFHRKISELAKQAAGQVGQELSRAIKAGQLDQQSLQQPDYYPIPNTNPEKHNTDFDSYCDKILPTIQEPILQSDAAIAYAITADINGYVPTHNNVYCQPLTGDSKVDIVGNRTKRIFSDHVGRSVGRHTREYMLQVYRRDTGAIMFDLSVPIYVDGWHFGGFRIGYFITA